MNTRTTELCIDRAAATDGPTIARLLRDANLPHEDFAAHLEHFLVARRGDRVVGAVGAEVYAPDALLRSLVVAPDERGAGLGGRLLDAMESAAVRWDVSRWWLLTTSADRFFIARGFQVVARNGVPAAIAATAEFRELCPSSAICLSRVVSAAEERRR